MDEPTKDFKELLEDLNVFTLQDVRELRQRSDILERIRFDVTPRMIMEPRMGPEAKKEIAGYVFYIETFEPPPTLMLMRVNKGGVITTVGKVSEIPRELLERAVAEPPDPPCNGMYAVTAEIREWLREHLGIASS